MSQTISLAMFEQESIGKLMFRFSLPAIISMVVNALYNIVDQIFIGQGVGFLGNAATNITFPLSAVLLAVGLLIADGCAACFSLTLGDKRYEDAARIMGNGVSLSCIVSVLLALLAQLLLPTLLCFCGGTPGSETFAYAMTYGRITLTGIPFLCVSMAINGLIRAEGHPKYSMCCMLTGCITNVLLDAWFVLGLGWGIAGAAWATVIGQALNFLLAVCFLPKFKTIKFLWKNTRLDPGTLASFLPLGLSSFCTQFVTAIVIICYNNLFVKYGQMSIYGADIPLAAQGITIKVNSIVTGVMTGLGIGSQPIIGYNYGAKNYARVRAVYLRTIAAGLFFGLLGWACFRIFPQQIVGLFGQSDALYNEFAVRFFLDFLMLVFLSGFFMPSGIFFQAIGKPGKAMFASLARNIFFFIPFGYILGHFMGIYGLLYAAPVSDACSTVTVAVLILFEMRNINALIRENRVEP